MGKRRREILCKWSASSFNWTFSVADHICTNIRPSKRAHSRRCLIRCLPLSMFRNIRIIFRDIQKFQKQNRQKSGLWCNSLYFNKCMFLFLFDFSKLISLPCCVMEGFKTSDTRWLWINYLYRLASIKNSPRQLICVNYPE